jgi:pimeloyl-ACP methyl ester carboxylesterase
MWSVSPAAMDNSSSLRPCVSSNVFSNFVLLVAACLGLCHPLKCMTISEQFEQFRQSHPISHRTVSGNDWSFIDTGAGERVAVILPGGGGDAESMFPVVSALEQQFRVIAIGYSPTATTVKEAVEGVQAILDERGVEHCSLLGHSLGGFIERAFAQAWPKRVDSLIIANSAIYTPARALLIKMLLPISFALPRSVIVSAIRSKFGGLLKSLPASDREFWMSYVNQSEMMKPQSQGLRSQVRLMRDCIRYDRDQPAAAPGWHGRVLIIESSEETGFTLKERRNLRARYPGATVHIIQHAGHTSFITHPREFVETIGDFLAEKRN